MDTIKDGEQGLSVFGFKFIPLDELMKPLREELMARSDLVALRRKLDYPEPVDE